MAIEIGGLEVLLFLFGLFSVLTFYFTLTFFQLMREGERVELSRAKRLAVVSFAANIAVLLVILYGTL